MQKLKKYSKISTIALILMLTMSASLIIGLPTVNAGNYYDTIMYVAVSRDPIGVGQELLLVTWTNNVPPDIGEGIGLVPGGRQAWYGLTMEVTKPDGTIESFTIEKSDPVGSAYIVYTPDQVGTYYVQAFFPGAQKNVAEGDPRYPLENYYEAAETIKLPFTVQEDPIEGWPESPLPTGYWTRPINQASRDWSVLLGDWLGTYANVWPPGSYGGNTQRFLYSTGPESAHVLWTKSIWAGGIMTNYFGNIGYQTSHYQGVSFTPIILEGKIFYPYRATPHTNEGYLCVDLYTGETLYYSEESMPNIGQIYDYESPNQHGGFPYLWRTNVQLPETFYYASTYEVVNTTETPMEDGRVWEMIDGHTGNHGTYVANVSQSGRNVYGKDGSILYYNIANIGTNAAPNYRLTVWNSSNVQTFYGGLGSAGTIRWQWRPMGGGGGGSSSNNPVRDLATRDDIVHDGNTAFSLNVSVPDYDGGSIYVVREGEYLIVGSAGNNDWRGLEPAFVQAISLAPGQEGTTLWETTFNPPLETKNVSISMTGIYPEDGVILFEDRGELVRYGYDMRTGQFLWKGETEEQFNYFSMAENVYEGLLLSTGFGGQLRAYNMTTGEIVWNFDAETIGWESPYGNYPINVLAIADGKIYTLTGEHSISQPMFRGPNLRCINASNGEELWNLLNFGANGGASLGGIYVYMAESKIVALNFLDNQLYCIGIGNSATTVTASPKVTVLGSSVQIEGTVTDQSPSGRRNTNDIIDFTLKGTPAISDEDMGRWMEYMFMQQGIPADAKGVTVKLSAIDPNGNYQDIGTTTSDVHGNFGKSWVPPVPGEYYLTAEFEGSNSYGSSSATTYFVVDPAPTVATQIKPEPAAPAPTEPTPTEPTPTEPGPTEPTPTEPEPTTPELKEPEPTEPTAEAPLLTTEVAIIAAVAVASIIGIAAFLQLRKRK